MKQIKIKSIKKLDKRNDRYDLTVPKNSNFFANGILIHNTSARTGNLLGKFPLTPAQTWWNNYFWWLKKFEHKNVYQHVTGTRRVVLNPDATEDSGYYSGKTFRVDIHKKIKESVSFINDSDIIRGLPKGVTLFYEIAAFDETGKSIMSQQPIDKITDKKMKKLMRNKYGDIMTYSYGCDPKDSDIHARYRIFVYRATITNEDGNVFELPWPKVKNLCESLNLECVPELRDSYFYNNSENEPETLLNIVEEFLDKDSIVNSSHITEGVCVRVETPDGRTYILKDKGYLFKVLEGIVKSDETIVDTEEAEDLQN